MGASAPAVDCAGPSPSWQVLWLYFNPPGPWPRSASYWPTEVRFELRNLADGSRVRCYLAQDDVTGWDTSGLVLRSNREKLGVAAGFPSRVRGCEVGWWYDDNSAPELLGWKSTPVPEITFHTKSHLFTINQTWPCAGDAGGVRTVTGYAEQTLDLDCETTGLSFSPNRCEATVMMFSDSSAPVVLGPGVSTVVAR